MRTAEAADHLFTLYLGLFDHLGPAPALPHQRHSGSLEGGSTRPPVYAQEALALAVSWGLGQARLTPSASPVTSRRQAAPRTPPGYYREALALADTLGMRPLIAYCHLGLGKLYRRTDKREQAQAQLATATTMYRDMGMTYWLEKAEAEARERG